MSGADHDVHEWLSFEDPDENRTWVFDVTFLLSNWSCIYGGGCQGVLPVPSAELGHGCCTHGAHFIDDADTARVVALAGRLSPAQWQNKRKADHGGFLSFDELEKTTTTRVLNGVCIFHNASDFPGGGGCALHLAALQAGARPLDWKPDVCWQLPLRLDEFVDANGHVTSTLREWKRRDWGEGGNDFHWWCTESPDAFVGAESVLVCMSDEITEFVGEQVYATLVDLIERRNAMPAVPLPHPAVKRRNA